MIWELFNNFTIIEDTWTYIFDKIVENFIHIHMQFKEKWRHLNKIGGCSPNWYDNGDIAL
jgi:hypothetical protein